jgi:hypothetical protein
LLPTKSRVPAPRPEGPARDEQQKRAAPLRSECGARHRIARRLQFHCCLPAKQGATLSAPVVRSALGHQWPQPASSERCARGCSLLREGPVACAHGRRDRRDGWADAHPARKHPRTPLLARRGLSAAILARRASRYLLHPTCPASTGAPAFAPATETVATSAATSRSSIASIPSRSADVLDDPDA